jgi:uncharacterized membrane protein YoaK (UPF0700 family)
MGGSDRRPRPLVVTLAALNVVSGFVDAVSFLGLGHVFTASMTGNVVVIGLPSSALPVSPRVSACARRAFLAGAVAEGSARAAGSPAGNLHAGATWSLGVATSIVAGTAVFFARAASREIGPAL